MPRITSTTQATTIDLSTLTPVRYTAPYTLYNWDWMQSFIDYGNTVIHTQPPEGATITVGTYSSEGASEVAQTPVSSPAVTVAPAEAIVVAPPTPPPAPRTLADLYDDRSDLRYRLFHGSIFKYKGEWVYSRCNYSYSTHYESLELIKLSSLKTQRQANTQFVKFRDALIEDFDFDSYSVGYCNYGNKALWVTKPTEEAKGFSARYLPGNLSRIMHEQPFIDMLSNHYPTIEEAWTKVSQSVLAEPLAVAFHKDYCFRRDTLSVVTLNRRNEQIGEVVLAAGVNQSNIKLYPAFDHLVRQAKKDLGLQFELFNINA